VRLRDVILALGASTDSRVNRLRFLDHDFAAVADFGLLQSAAAAAAARGLPVRVGNVFSSDLFYPPDLRAYDVLERMGILALEMEVAGLYGVAAEHGVRALGMLTVSDHVRRDEHLSAEDRQTTFDDMIALALDTALAAPA
jgi:purine-nucleoside phosphorylase